MGEPGPGRRPAVGPRPVAAGLGTDEPTLFDPDDLGDAEPAAPPKPDRPAGARRVVRVLPDEVGIDKAFDYAVPDAWSQVGVGDRVRVALGPRRVGGWVVATDVEPEPGVTVRPLAKHSGLGPSADLIDLAGWARWRWAARSAVPFLRTSSPARNVGSLPAPASPAGPVPGVADPVLAPVLASAFEGGCAVLRLPPAEDLLPVVQAAAGFGAALIVCPSRAMCRELGARLRRLGVPVAIHPEDWGRAAAGGSVVLGTRASAWARVGGLSTIVLVDEHDEVHQEESSPTWHARDVAVERAARAGVPCVLVSPIPTLEALRAGRVVVPGRARERAGWPATVVVDRTEDDAARNGLFSPTLAEVIRSGARVVCVLNQKGRAALLACGSCSRIARCDECGGAVAKPDAVLVCRRCGVERPVVCAECGGTGLRTVRLGVTRVVEDLAALAGEPVAEVTGSTTEPRPDRHRLVVGTEAALHRVGQTDVVAFLDFDQELLNPRYRAEEQALALLVRGARLVGGRAWSGERAGRLLIQTRLPDHVVCQAAVLGDPERAAAAFDAARAEWSLPPHSALAEVGGAAAEEYVARIPGDAGVVVQGPQDGRWRVRAPDHPTLCDVLAEVPRPAGRLRLAVDPPRL